MPPINEEDKDRYFQEWISKKIPSEVQNNYKEQIGWMRGGFECGVKFVLSLLKEKDAQ